MLINKITLTKQLYSAPQVSKVSAQPSRRPIITSKSVAPLPTLRFSSLKLFSQPCNNLWSSKLSSFLPSRSTLSSSSLVRQSVRFYSTSQESSSSQAPSRTADDLIKNVAWLDIEAEKNPYQVRVLDLSPFTTEAKAYTKDPAVQKRFNELREEPGEGYMDAKPSNAKTTNCDLQYPMIVTEDDREALETTLLNPEFIGPFFKAHSMEQKWDVYLLNRKLYFCRSWAGNLVFTATISKIKEQTVEGDKEVILHINHIEFSPETVNDDPEYATRVVDFLIKTYLFGDIAPFPLSPKLKGEPNNIKALVSNGFQWFGSDALYGSFEDTTPFLRKDGFFFPEEMEGEDAHEHEHGEHCNHDHHHHGHSHGHHH